MRLWRRCRGRPSRSAYTEVSESNRRSGPPTSRRGSVTQLGLIELWRRHKASGDERARERLVLSYAPLVKYVAGRLSSELPAHVEQAGLISYGMNGLLAAIDRFDLSRDVKFETYAITRIRCEIIDQLRKLGLVPGSVRAHARDVEQANATLAARLQRAPSDQEVASELGIDLDEFRERLMQMSSSIAALDELWSVSDSGCDQVSLLDTLRIEVPSIRRPSLITKRYVRGSRRRSRRCRSASGW